jgi:hypothetical protein
MVNSSSSPNLRLQALEESRQATLAALAELDESTLIQLTRLSLPEIRAIQKDIAEKLPAGNLPAFILSGLLKLKDRQLSPDRVSRDLNALLRGTSLVPSRGLYSVFVAGPAAALYAYQKILQLAGIDPASAFPQGTWQFYLEFGLREDAAHHAVEATAFHRAIPTQAHPVLAATAWVYGAIELIYNFDELLAIEWEERVVLRLLAEEAEAAGAIDHPVFADMERRWRDMRPYHAPSEGGDYLPYRTACFQRFVQERLVRLPPEAHTRFYQRYEQCRAEDLGAYQDQMTILAALKPDRYKEHKEFIPIWQAAVGFIWQGQTYLLPVCEKDEQGCPLCYLARGGSVPPVPLYTLPNGNLCDAVGRPLRADRAGRVWYRDDQQLLGYLSFPPPEVMLGWMASILSAPPPHKASDLDLLLAETPRSLQQTIREQLPEATQMELNSLRRAPILVNWDVHPPDLPLADVRRGRRGIGDHAMTTFRTPRSIVHDLSHIFFDGGWSMAVAEILSDYAVQWYDRLETQAVAKQVTPPLPLVLAGSEKAKELAGGQRRPGEVSAESTEVDMKKLARLRQWLYQRGTPLTVNDLLLLYRSIHAAQYQPSRPVRRAIDSFRGRASSPEARAALQSIEETLARLQATNPALLIPMDASYVSPHERVFPTTFRNPLNEIFELFATAKDHYRAYLADPTLEHWKPFDQERRTLLAYLQAFGQLQDALKSVTRRGESFNTATIRLLAHLPASMQHLLDQIPQRIGVLNEVIKGTEVFSNVGRVAAGTSLTRFISARDDGETKELVWGILTDDENCMHVTLRDFRPFVSPLLALGEEGLARLLVQDYVESYALGFNRFVAELSTLITAREPEEED